MEKYFVGVYCPPMVPKYEHPNRITPRAYRMLKEVGIDHVFGCFEDEAGPEYLKMAMQYAADAGILFYPRLEIFNHFLGITGSSYERYRDFPTYADMPAQKQEALLKQLMEEIAECSKAPSFGGIFMYDEQRHECFPAIGIVQKQFSKAYPDKLFMCNNINYMSANDFFEFSPEPVDRQLKMDLAPTEENRFKRYEYFIDLYLKQIDTEYISTDVYPFLQIWDKVLTSIHRNLYEIQSFFADIKCKTGRKPLVYIQVGNWEGEQRIVGKPEMALDIGIAAAYDADGFVFFPGCWPNDWLDTPESFAKYGKAALFDVYGEPTQYFCYAKQLISHFQKIADFIHGAKWLGVNTLGEFEGGFGNVDIREQKWGSCIYRGGLPENEKHPYTEELPEISTDKQLFIGVFQDGTQKYLLLVNNSIVAANHVSISAGVAHHIIQQGGCRDYNGETVEMEPGESILVILN